MIQPVIEVHGSRVGVEVSGGPDSANVALSAATGSPRVLVSLGLLVGGPAAEHQRQTPSSKNPWRSEATQ